MANLLKQSSTAQPLVFRMLLSSDHATGSTGLSPVVKLSKNGGTGVAPSGAVSEIDAANLPGWYRVAGNATDTNTLGPLILCATGASSDVGTVVFDVVAFDPQAALATPTNITAGTITTVTNLTNAATAGDLTATMKASVNAEATLVLGDYAPTVAGDQMNLVDGAITATKLAGDTITAAKIAADAGTEIATAVWALATRTLTSASDSSGITTLLTRIASALTITSGKVTVGTNDDKTGYGLSDGAITAAKLAADAITAAKVAADVSTEIASQVNTTLSSSHGSGAWGANGGSGAYAITVTVTDGSSPLQSAIVRLTEGVNVFSGATNVSGQITFSLDAATYTVAITKAGYSFTPLTRTVTGTQAGTLVNNLVMAQVFTPAVPSDPTMCLVYGYVRSQSTGLLLAGVTVTATRQPNIPAYAGGLLVGSTKSAVSDGAGLFELELEKNTAIDPAGTSWLIVCPAANLSTTQILTTDTFNLEDVVQD